MTREDLAEIMNGRTYGQEISEREALDAAEFGLVAVFGASDDIVVFKGAINDEYDGLSEEVILSEDGVVTNECSDEECPYFKERYELASRIRPEWGHETGWTYDTDIPHSTFEIMEDGELYCVGIVFYINDIEECVEP